MKDFVEDVLGSLFCFVCIGIAFAIILFFGWLLGWLFNWLSMHYPVFDWVFGILVGLWFLIMVLGMAAYGIPRR
ncbi:MAG: hypothetical protein JO125_15325 [Chloroflexi bacterium]|nr:hypothetical protein [Ktedonobacteraceae bacterium]MBV9019800.1 hypothetical protein [Ktedonobacteraceae bacterium]MBV9708768.1 hypothetical protein [Chloroflexota bacterium]